MSRERVRSAYGAIGYHQRTVKMRFVLSKGFLIICFGVCVVILMFLLTKYFVYNRKAATKYTLINTKYEIHHITAGYFVTMRLKVFQQHVMLLA